MEFDAIRRRGQRHRAANLSAGDVATAIADCVAERDAVPVRISSAAAKADGAGAAASGIGRTTTLERPRGEFADTHLLWLTVAIQVCSEPRAVRLLKRHAGSLAAHAFAVAGCTGLKAASLAPDVGDAKRARLAGVGRRRVTAVANCHRNGDGLTAPRRCAIHQRRLGLETTGEPQGDEQGRNRSPHTPRAQAIAQGRCCRRESTRR